MAKFHNDPYFRNTSIVVTYSRLISHTGVFYLNYMDYIPSPYL